jgi:hypothetical protein
LPSQLYFSAACLQTAVLKALKVRREGVQLRAYLSNKQPNETADAELRLNLGQKDRLGCPSNAIPA